ncbi:DUF503 domain-containing protein [Brevibacillus laterosporus]|uniref:DUF503 domain-containing protein n=1 Tax=Brevibacillus laterosporus TaxID=1465 RepID=UPI0018CF42CF|nr:DUF503 domain-containing protein [Brevibacillus laterosporus]MBG9788059.1 hypothetical protein [Brevibacillus laterosporus]
MVAVTQLELFMPYTSSLKEKRSIIKSVMSQIRNKYNVSIAEIDFHEQWQRTLLEVAAVANEYSFLQKKITTIVRFVETFSDVELIRADTEYYD